jgi:hypothetical protein
MFTKQGGMRVLEFRVVHKIERGLTWGLKKEAVATPWAWASARRGEWHERGRKQGGRRKGASPELRMGHGSGAKADQGIDTQKGAGLMWQNHLRNEEFIFQDPDRVILDEARMHAKTHTNHSKS